MAVRKVTEYSRWFGKVGGTSVDRVDEEEGDVDDLVVVEVDEDEEGWMGSESG